MENLISERKYPNIYNKYGVRLWTIGHICCDFSYSMFTIQSIGEERQRQYSAVT